VVLCRIPNELIGECEARYGIPIGIGLFLALLLYHASELMMISWSWMRRCLRL